MLFKIIACMAICMSQASDPLTITLPGAGEVKLQDVLIKNVGTKTIPSGWSTTPQKEIDDLVMKVIIESMVDDPEGFKKELDEILELCGMEKEQITQAQEILRKLDDDSKGHDLFMQELPNYKKIVQPLIKLINEQQESSDIKYYIILNSELRKLNAKLKTKDNPEPLKQEMDNIVPANTFNELIKIYDQIACTPITFVAKKWMLSAVLEKMFAVFEKVFKTEMNKAVEQGKIQKFAVLKLYFEKQSKNYNRYAHFEQDDYPKLLLGTERNFDSYIGNYTEGLYITTNRAIDRAIDQGQISANDLRDFGKNLVKNRIEQIDNGQNYYVAEIFSTLYTDSNSIDELKINKARFIFERMQEAIKEFLKGRSFNTAPFIGSTMVPEDARKLRDYTTDSGSVGSSIFHILDPIAEYASTAKIVVDTIKLIEKLANPDKPQEQTTKPA